jgi:hypothetical protein
MDSGKALLDPRMTFDGATAADTASAQPPPSTTAVSNAVLHMEAPSSATNLMHMLVPASSIRWGTVWEDSAASTTEELMNSLEKNSSSRAASSSSASDQPAHGTNANSNNVAGLYVELSVNIVKASIVRDPTLM